MTALEFQPTIFGFAGIDPLVGPDGSTEYSRALLWFNNRAARLAFGAQLRVPLIGDPIYAFNVRAQWQPLLDFKNDQMTPPYEDFDYDDPPTNWGPNS